MNESGPSVAGWVSYYKLRAEQTLVVHDELNLPCGRVALKRSGGHGGHNGLRDIISHLNANFVRARIGIGYPDSQYDVANYVLNVPSVEDLRRISWANTAILENIETIAVGDFEAAMKSISRALSQH
jgi:PTH1 family peptidyl-tRNA hydrolase